MHEAPPFLFAVRDEMLFLHDAIERPACERRRGGSGCFLDEPAVRRLHAGAERPGGVRGEDGERVAEQPREPTAAVRRRLPESR